jgi:glycogen(starch) synthase
MRVMFWQEPFWPQVGGMSVAAEALLHELSRRGHTIAVVTDAGDFSPPERNEKREEHEDDAETVEGLPGIAVTRFPFWRVLRDGHLDRIAALQRSISALKRHFAADVVHLSGIGPSMAFHWQSARHDSTPTLLTLHSTNTLSGAENTLARRTLQDARWVVGCSRSIVDEARHVLPSIRSRSSVIYNGVRPPPLAPASLPEAPALLCVGRLEAHKGFDCAIGALAILRERFPDLHLVVAGDGPERRSLERQAAEAGVGPAVRFLGPVPHDRIHEVINDATLVLVPSRRESFSLVAVEAALMRRAVVATRVGGLPEVVSHGETGILIEEPGSAALAAAVGNLLADPETVARMGTSAERRAIERFSVARHADAYARLHRRLAAETRLVDRGAVSR